MRKLKRTQKRHATTNRRFKHRLVATGTAAAMVMGTASSLAKTTTVETPDPHQVAVPQDHDSDLLTDREETALGYRAYTADQNRNGMIDGAELAMRCAAAMEELSPHIEMWKAEVFGLERCDICGETVNMGLMGIINHRLNLEAQFPIIALHYLQHGAFGYAGDVHNDRLDVARLARALELRFPGEADDHQLSLDYTIEPTTPIAPDANDLDGDLLADSEELAAGLNLYDADQDENLTPDGIQLAQQCAEIIGRLPIVDPNVSVAKGIYRISYMMRGIETCPICGASVNMGYWQVVNVTSGLSVDVAEIALHYMQHGSFSYFGDYHGSGRTDVAALLKVLELPSASGDLGIPYDPVDLNQDGRVDIEDFTEFAQRWLESIDPTVQ